MRAGEGRVGVFEENVESKAFILAGNNVGFRVCFQNPANPKAPSGRFVIQGGKARRGRYSRSSVCQ